MPFIQKKRTTPNDKKFPIMAKLFYNVFHSYYQSVSNLYHDNTYLTTDFLPYKVWKSDKFIFMTNINI